MISSILCIAVIFLDGIMAAPTSSAVPNKVDLKAVVGVIKGMPISDFESDYILERTDGLTFVNNGKGGKTTFKLRTPPEDDAVILLSGDEDKLRRGIAGVAKQRTFVLLRQKEKEDYYVSYVYLRDLFADEATPAGQGLVQLSDGVKRRIEFDTWDRRGEDSNYEQHFGWTLCTKSFFVSCYGTTGEPETLEYTPFAGGDDEPDYATSEETKDTETNSSSSTHVRLKNDYFTDLDDEFEHAWFVGAIVIFSTNTKLRIATTVADAYPDMESAPFLPAGRKKRAVFGSQVNGEGCNEGIFEKSATSLNTLVKHDIMGAGTNQNEDSRWREGSDRRGLHGDQDNPSDDGLLKPIDTITQSFQGWMGYSPGKPSNTSGQRFANAARNSAGSWTGISEGAADAIGLAMGVGMISNDRSHLDGILEETVAGLFAGTGGAIVDIASIIAKPLGLDPLLGTLAGVGGTLLGGLGLVFSPIKLGIDFGKVAFKALGLGGLIGMNGSSNKACLNKMAFIEEYAEKQKRYNNYYNNEPYDSDSSDETNGQANSAEENAVGEPAGASNWDDYDRGNQGDAVSEEDEPVQMSSRRRKNKRPKEKAESDEDSSSEEKGKGGGGNTNIKVTVNVNSGRALGASGRTFGSKVFQYKGSYSEKQSGLDASIDLYTPVGWRGLLSHQEEPFVGIGNCLRNTSLTIGDLQYLQANPSTDELTKFFLTSLRTRCSGRSAQRLAALIDKGSLEPTDEQSLSAAGLYGTLAKQAKLAPEQLSELSQSIEMQVYSKAYVTYLRSPAELDGAKSPDGSPLSRSIYFLLKFTFEMFAEAVKNFSAHLIKLIRNTLLTLKTAFIKLLQNKHIIGICQLCLQAEKDEVQADTLTIYTLMQFLMEQFEPPTTAAAAGAKAVKVTDSAALENAYNTFYKEKKKEFEERLDWYVSVPNGKNIYALVE